MKIYLIGSLRNLNIPSYSKTLREAGFEVFDDWFAVGPKADDHWMEYEKARGRTYAEALRGYAARHTFQFDKTHIDDADVGVLIYPAGKSAHLELGYMIGQGKPGYILIPEELDRWDVMTQFANAVAHDLDEIVARLKIEKYTRIP